MSRGYTKGYSKKFHKILLPFASASILLALCFALVFSNVNGAILGNDASDCLLEDAVYADPYLLNYTAVDLDTIPEYTGANSVEINNNLPGFTTADLSVDEFEHYTELDDLGRCGVATANIGPDMLSYAERGDISAVHPTGWQSVEYPDQIEDVYMYNRCHLIAHCLTGQDDNEQNLITGTHHMNVLGMYPFEKEVLLYIRETGNHVLYRVTPIFNEDDLVVTGVQMEAYSVEDDGLGICFNVFIYNIQPGITIDYHTGASAAVY